MSIARRHLQGAARGQALTRDRIGFYPFNEGTGTVAHTTVGAAHLTVAGIANWTVSGYSGTGLTSNAGTRAAYGTILPNVTELTLLCRAKLLSYPGWQSFIEIVNGATTDLFFEVGSAGAFDVYVATSGTLTVNAPALALNQWYQLGFTLSTITKTVEIYINGDKVATGTDASMPAQFNWSAATVNVCGSGSSPSDMLLDDLSIYSKVLAPAQIAALYSSGSPNAAPTASFTTSVTNLSVSVDASASTDSDGTITAYAWNWGDATANSSGKTATHTYASAGTYTVTLTVTDSGGATATTTHSVTATTPGLVAGGSIFYPVYVAQNTVYTRSVASMPLASNSAAIASYIQGNYNGTGAHITSWNLPIYIVDSTSPLTPPNVTVNYSGPYDLATKDQGWVQHLFNTNIPMPSWAQPELPLGGDCSLALYDIATGVMREYFSLVKQGNGTWTAWAGGYALNMSTMATANYACQHTYGTDFAFGGLGGPSEIGIEEVRRDAINHAIGVVMYNARSGVTSWPATNSDGTDTNANAPAQSQWFRFDPALNLDSLGLRPLTLMVCKAIQTYGGFPVDKSLTSNVLNFEPGYNELHEKGVNPWEPGGDLYVKFGGDYSVSDFPWNLTQWAPVDWGQP